MRCACWRALLPSAIAVCLPVLGLSASAADLVTVPDGDGTWAMEIAPRPAFASQESAAGDRPILLAAYQEDTEDEGAVPQPIEPAPGPADPPQASEQNEAAEPLPTVSAAPAVDPAAYWCVYRTIPFLRTEYLANPSYRHEATMEFLFGQLRPTVVHKHREAAPAPVQAAPSYYRLYPFDIFPDEPAGTLQRYWGPTFPFGYGFGY